jgi:hypothetical protein
MILSGEKTEEYREIKPYWQKRFVGKNYDCVKLTNGYRKDSPSVTLRLIAIEKDFGWIGMGADFCKLYFVLYLREILSKNN